MVRDLLIMDLANSSLKGSHRIDTSLEQMGVSDSDSSDFRQERSIILGFFVE
jgi:hypothetical protein